MLICLHHSKQVCLELVGGCSVRACQSGTDVVQERAGGETAVLRIVSLQADTTNRGHAFDMDLSDLLLEGKPLPYAQAREYFRSDPSQRYPLPSRQLCSYHVSCCCCWSLSQRLCPLCKAITRPPIAHLAQQKACQTAFPTSISVRSWAAYVAGALLVLMHEEGCTFDRGISLLVSSEVPDGKGVSSSAALEVAAMTAIAAAHDIVLEPARLAALCQKVGRYLLLLSELVRSWRPKL